MRMDHLITGKDRFRNEVLQTVKNWFWNVTMLINYFDIMILGLHIWILHILLVMDAWYMPYFTHTQDIRSLVSHNYFQQTEYFRNMSESIRLVEWPTHRVKVSYKEQFSDDVHITCVPLFSACSPKSTGEARYCVPKTCL